MRSDHNEKLSTMKGLILKNLEKMKSPVGTKAKNEYVSKQEKTINDITDRYEEAKHIADKTFEIVEGQLTKFEEYIDDKEKRQIDEEYYRQLSEATEVINMRFDQEQQARNAFEKKFKQLVNQRFDVLKSDLTKEVQMRNISITNLEQSIHNGFEKIEQEMKHTAEEAENADIELNKIFDDLIDRVKEEKDQIEKEKNITEEAILDQLKQVGKIKEEIMDEKKDREGVEETLLSLLESICHKLQPGQQKIESRLSSPQKVVHSPS